MKDSAHLHREIVALRIRLSRLSEASLSINESLEIDTVPQCGPSPVKPCVAGDLVIDAYKRSVAVGGEAVQLTATDHRMR